MGHTGGAELLKDVGEQKDVHEEVQVVVVGESRHIERQPYVFDIGDAGLAEPDCGGSRVSSSRAGPST